MERCLRGAPGLPGLAAPLPGRWSDVVHEEKQGRTQAHLLLDQEELTNCKGRHQLFFFFFQSPIQVLKAFSTTTKAALGISFESSGPQSGTSPADEPLCTQTSFSPEPG